MRHLCSLIGLLLISCFHSFGQAVLHEANEYFAQRKYLKSIPYFEEAFQKKPTYEAASKLAFCFNHLKNTASAEYWYQKALGTKDYDPNLRLEYADVLKQNQRYAEAKEQYRLYGIEMELEMAELNELMAYCDSAQAWLNTPPRQTIKALEGVNTIHSEMVGRYMNNQLSFSSDRVEGMSPWKQMNEETGTAYFEMYTANIDGLEVWNVNHLYDVEENPYHEGPGAFDTLGRKIVFNAIPVNLRKNQDYHGLDIFFGTVVGDEIIEKVPFAYNTDEFSEGHPYLSTDGKRLYFISDNPNGYGGTDIYVSVKKDSTWGEPMNLGPGVNSKYDEQFPSERNSNELYFSSNRPSSMGGLDIYQSKKERGLWQQAENMKAPLNSPMDDFALTFKDGTDQGLLTSNRFNGRGSDDLYAFYLVPPDSVLKMDSLLALQELDSIVDALPIAKNLKIAELRLDFGVAEDSSTFLKGSVVEVSTDEAGNRIGEKPISGSDVVVINQESGNQKKTVTNEEGKFQVKNDPEELYSIRASKDGYFSQGTNIKINPEDSTITVLEENDILTNIEYDFDDFRLKKESFPTLDKIAALMMIKPDLKIVIRSYCDTRGDENYNKRLSEKRAASVKGYLISKGISASRMVPIGYGEAYPIIKNAKTEEEHQVNRRTEFDFIRPKQKPGAHQH